MDENSFTADLIDGIRRILEPIEVAFTNEETFNSFLKTYGWDTSLNSNETNSVKDAFAVSGLIIGLEQLFEQIEEGADELEIIKEVFTIVPEIYKIIKALSPGPTLPAPFNQDAFWDEFVPDLLNDLTLDVIQEELSTLYAVMTVVGLFEEREESPVETTRVQYTKRIIHWDKLGDFVTDPLKAIKNAYRWENAVEGFDYKRFNKNIDTFFTQIGFTPNIEVPVPSLLDDYYSIGNPDRSEIRQVSVPFVLEIAEGFNSFAEIGIAFLPITPAGNKNSKPHGFLLAPLVAGNVSGGIPGSLEDVSFGVSPSFEDGSIGRIEIRPESVDFVGPSTPSIDASVSLTGKPDSPYILIGAENSHRIELEGFWVSLGIKGQVSDLEVIFEAGTTQGSDQRRLRFILQASEGDSFLNSLLGDEPQSIDLSGKITFSSRHGISINGSIGFQIQIPLHLSLGPVEIETLQLAPSAKSGGGAEIPVGINVRGNLGPLTAVVENIGVKLVLISKAKKDETGILGNLDTEWSFKPPNGVGLSIDTGVVKGGGYLFFDFDREEYAGALELVVSEWIALKAIGLVTTKMPDGSKGFSLLIIITVEFDTGYQLGYGFTLLGVGGLLGLNRIVKVDPLKEGIRNGAVENVMFPKDVIANAPRIISDLRQFFPPQKDIFLVGPMAKIGWGTPPIMKAQLAVILEFPAINITILGIIKVVLPDEEAAILRLQVNFVGRIEPSNKLLWFYAELYDSKLLYMTLEGGFGLLVNWGDKANFVLSIGGFHPRYDPPPLPFREPPRLAIPIVSTPFYRITISAYFAVTSNSVQFGARAELFAGLSEFKIEGHLAFDALFRFDPFYFRLSLSMNLSVKVFGVGLFSVGFSGLFEGTTPWHIKGKGKIKVLFFKIKVPFELTWGSKKDTKLDSIKVFPLIEKEFDAIANWEARLPKSSKILVSLRKMGGSASDQLVLHPVGRLRISQRKVPMNFKLDKVGHQRPSDVDRLDVDATLGGGNLSISKVEEKFAIGQFKDLDASKQLSRPGFEPLKSGIEIGVAGEQMKTSRAVRRVIRYETIIIDNNFKRHVKPFFGFFIVGYKVLHEILFAHFLRGNAISQSVLSQHYKKRLQPFEEVIQVRPNQYSVAFNTDNRPMDAGSTTFTSQAQAFDYIELKVQDDPAMANRLHVIPNTELNLAA